MFIDIHTHLDQHDPAELPDIVARARGAGVGAIIVAGVTVDSSRRCIDLARAHPELFAGVGAHPQDLNGELDAAVLDELDRLAGADGVVVMSEIGLDFQARSPDRAAQEDAFRAQIEIARSHSLPVVWHMRESTAESLRVLREGRVWEMGGASHYFQGDAAEAHAVIDLGCKISLAKPLLRMRGLQELAAALPLSSIVLETDSYPQPFKNAREKWTEPKDLSLVAAKLAELRGVSVEEIEAVTTHNALEMLGERAARVQIALES